MTAAVLNSPLIIEQGATWDFAIIWKTDEGDPVDLTGCAARMQLRRNYDSPIILDLDSLNGTLDIDVSTGKISAQVSATETAAMSILGGVFDLEVYHPDGHTDRVLQGEWVLSREVTK